MEKLILFLPFLIAFAEATNYLNDGDLQALTIATINYYTGSWYHKDDINAGVFIGSFYGNKVLEPIPNIPNVCQNVTLGFKADFRWTFIARHLATTKPIMDLTINDEAVLSENISSNSYLNFEASRTLSPATYTVCF